MIKKISLMGLELDNYPYPEAVKIIEAFLNDTAVSTVLTVNMEKLLAACEDEVVKEVISSADYTVVTDRAILEAVSRGGSARVSEVERGAFPTGLLNHFYRADRTFYLAASTQEQLEEMRASLTGSFSYIRIVGGSVIPRDASDYESCVNAINIKVPDVILSSLDTPDEERFLKKCRSQLCAGIWYGVGKEPLDEKGLSPGRWLRRMKERITFRSHLHN